MCARSADDLERMVKALVRHQRPVQSMLAAILEEADEHVPELIKRLQQSRDPMLRSVAEQYAHPHLPRLALLAAHRCSKERSSKCSISHPQSDLKKQIHADHKGGKRNGSGRIARLRCIRHLLHHDSIFAFIFLSC